MPSEPIQGANSDPQRTLNLHSSKQSLEFAWKLHFLVSMDLLGKINNAPVVILVKQEDSPVTSLGRQRVVATETNANSNTRDGSEFPRDGEGDL
jgi:hypothetical protein